MLNRKHNLWRAFDNFLFPMKKWLLLKNNHIKARLQKPYPIYDQNQLKLIPNLWPRNSWKAIPFGAAHTYIAHIRKYLPPPRSFNWSSKWNAVTSEDNYLWTLIVAIGRNWLFSWLNYEQPVGKTDIRFYVARGFTCLIKCAEFKLETLKGLKGVRGFLSFRGYSYSVPTSWKVYL